ncbi:hypothetical protein [Candidatus Wolbachia massiliensis]|uniref:Ankyrin repeat domain protein n=1 Tax=Candidatus Wolbachia massiliensis TaxID=1845000 RepID=A0A7L7YS49_9RICK|nr:hypothetical protein [Candidatus Wolbachia massiliensis]QOD38151.1 hypothetical protein ID128_05080 [Candidatus Wolbachia massiliensis]
MTTKIVYEYENIREELTLLHYARLCHDEQAIKDILKEADKCQLLKEISDELMTSKCLGSQGELICTSSSVVYENGIAETHTLKVEFITSAGDITTYTKPCGSNGNSSDTTTKGYEGIPVTNDTKATDTPASIKLRENSNGLNSTGKLINENSAEVQKDTTTSTETATNTFTNKTNTLPSTETKPCFNSEPGKENFVTEEEKLSTKTTQQRQAIMAGTALLVSSVAFCALEMYVIAIIGGIVGLACISFALYNAIKPSTRLEKVECVEHFQKIHVQPYR